MKIFFRIVLSLIPLLLFSMLMGCGFQLRGQCAVPTDLKVLRISPDEPFDAFQRTLRQTLKTQGIQFANSRNNRAATLVLSQMKFTETHLAYGSDIQVNRLLLGFSFQYTVLDPDDQKCLPPGTVQVSRELTVNPSDVLGTENERDRITKELYVDASLQFMRQLGSLVGSQH